MTMDHSEAMRKISDVLGAMRERGDACAFAIAVAYDNGDTAEVYESADNARLLGAISRLNHRVLCSEEMPEDRS